MKEKLVNLFQKLGSRMTKMSNSPYLQAISGAMMGTLGLLIVGSISVLGLVLPKNYSFLSVLSHLAPTFSKLNTITIGSMSLYISVMVAYFFIKKIDENENGVAAGVISLLCFLIVTPLEATDNGNVIPTTWLGSSGVFCALIVGLVSARIFLELKRRKLVIKMPQGVPPMVTSVFASLIPTIVIGVIFAVINMIFGATSFGNMHQFIYSMVQVPLQGIGGSIAGIVVISIIGQILWFFGIHGGNVVLPVVQAVLMSMDAENLNAIAAGMTPPNITGYAFYQIIGWGGYSLGLVLLMLRAKSKQYRDVGKVSILPMLFGIGEPVMFGTPLVLNFDLFVPLVTNTGICYIISYILIKIGIVSRFSGVAAIFGLPIGAYAAVEGSVSIVILHLILQLVVGPLLWYPWFRRLDKKTYQRECEAAGKAEC